ncbi:MAG: hypothetical protein GX568_10290 [Candidatus Gastranaerophilales bacterium]|nr:hypothetical protein [Candidatus Gastranaerophilales bacterium]
MKTIDDHYKDWCGEHHTTNSAHPVHDSAEACDFAEYYFKEKSKELETQALNIPVVSGSLPSLDDATKVAVRISEEAITPPLDAKGQTMFIAGFQECIKWLNVVFGADR